MLRRSKTHLYMPFMMLLALCVLVTSAPSAADKIRIEVLRVGTPEKVKEFMEPVEKQFEKANPNVDVVLRYMGWGEWHAGYPAWLAANSFPDVIWPSTTQTPEMAAEGALLPLDRFVTRKLKNTLQFPVDNLAFRIPKGQSHIYRIPRAAPVAFYWNKDIFAKAGLDPEKPPKTWDQVVEYALKIKANTDAVPFGLNGKEVGSCLETSFLTFYHSWTNKPLLDPKTSDPLFTTPQAVAALQFMVDLFRKHAVTTVNPLEENKGTLRTLFVSGKLAMMTDFSHTLPAIQAGMKGWDENSAAKSRIGVTTMPAGPSGVGSSFFCHDGWAIWSGTKHPEVAWKIIEMMTFDANLSYLHSIKYGEPPITKAVAKFKEFDTWYWKPFYEQIKKSFIRPVSADYRMLSEQALLPNIQAALAGKMTPKQALEQAAKYYELNRRY